MKLHDFQRIRDGFGAECFHSNCYLRCCLLIKTHALGLLNYEDNTRFYGTIFWSNNKLRTENEKPFSKKKNFSKENVSRIGISPSGCCSRLRRPRCRRIVIVFQRHRVMPKRKGESRTKSCVFQEASDVM